MKSKNVLLLLIIMATLSLNSQGTYAENKYLVDLGCHVLGKELIIKYSIENKDDQDIFLIDSQVFSVKEQDELLYVTLGRQKEIRGLSYNYFPPPENAKVQVGGIFGGSVTIDINGYEINKKSLRNITLSAAFSKIDLFKDQYAIDPDKFFREIKQRTIIEEAACAVTNETQE